MGAAVIVAGGLASAGARYTEEQLRIGLTVVAVLLALALTGWFAAWLTGLPPLRLVLRNLVLGAVTLGTGVVIGLISGGKSVVLAT